MENLLKRMCNKCKIEKPFEEMVKKVDCKGGYAPLCKSCKLLNQKVSRKKDGNRLTKQYEKTPQGYLMRTYRNMLSRVSGVQSTKAHLYESLPILEKEKFYDWSLHSSNFMNLFRHYENSLFCIKQAPSIDRIDSSKGYTLDNIRWITHSLNSRLGAEGRWKKDESVQQVPVGESSGDVSEAS